MAAITSMFSSAMNIAGDMQGVKDRLPGSLTSIREGVNSKFGDKRSFKTATGQRDIVELGAVGTSANVIKVRCTASNEEFIIKRLEMIKGGEGNLNEKGNPGLVSVEAMEALAQRADLIASLPQNPNLVQCFGVQADNLGKVPAKVVLMELCGESLKDVMAQGALKSEDLLHVFRDVTEGLFCLHTADLGAIVHGSVDPEHIYRDAKSGVWKLGSYGAAQRSSETANDIWQLGLLLLTLLFGSTAFDKDSTGSKTTDDEVHHSIVSSVATGRPCNNMEGRLLLMIDWLLTADPSKRPSAEQVVIAVGKLGEMPAPALALALPTHTRKQFRALCMALVRRTICEAIDNIDGSDRRILINKYGEEALRNPANLPTSVKQGALSTDQSKYIRVIQSFLPGELNSNSVSPDVKALSEALARAASETSDSPSRNETSDAQAPLDMLGFDEPPKTQELTQPPPVQDVAVDLMGLAPTSTSQEPAKDCGLDLLDMGAAPSSQVAETKSTALDSLQNNLGDLFNTPAPQPKSNLDALFNSPAPQPMVQPAAQFPSVQPMAQPAPQNPHQAVMAAFNSTPQQNPFGLPPAQQPQNMMQNQFTMASAQNGVSPMQPAPMPSQTPMFQQSNASAGYAGGMTQVAPPKQEEKKDPFAGLAGF